MNAFCRHSMESRNYTVDASVEEQARINAISTHIDIEAATEPGSLREAKVGSGREVSIMT